MPVRRPVREINAHPARTVATRVAGEPSVATPVESAAPRTKKRERTVTSAAVRTHALGSVGSRKSYQTHAGGGASTTTEKST